MNFENTLAFAKQMDADDILKAYREHFYIPVLNGKESIYLTGNSLGLQPKKAQDAVINELEDWANFGVEGHVHARHPWLTYNERFPEKLSPIIGALPVEIVVMNQLTTNLHLMLTTFYRPHGKREKILFESKAFPSDEYVINSQLELAGVSKEDALIEIKPDPGKHFIDNEKIIEAIKNAGDELALVLIGGVNYYNGQVFDMEAITAAAHEVGAYCGFDLAHGAGNVELKLHDWKVDFACWCTYKYLNSGPGGVGGVFIHEQHAKNKSLPRLAGWWGTNKETRFQMEKGFDPIPTAEGWQLSNAPVLSMAVHYASLEIFENAGFENIVDKGRQLSAYLIFILQEILKNTEKSAFEIITPLPEKEHGCQISLLMGEKGKHCFDMLRKNSVIADWREPNVIRVAPVPLYNTFQDVFTFGKILEHGLLD